MTDDIAETEFSYGQYDVDVLIKTIRSATGATYRLVNVEVSDDGAYHSQHSTKTMLVPGDLSERALFPLIRFRDTQDPRAQVRETVERVSHGSTGTNPVGTGSKRSRSTCRWRSRRRTRRRNSRAWTGNSTAWPPSSTNRPTVPGPNADRYRGVRDAEDMVDHSGCTRKSNGSINPLVETEKSV